MGRAAADYELLLYRKGRYAEAEAMYRRLINAREEGWTLELATVLSEQPDRYERLPHSYFRPFVQTRVREGATVQADIPNMCR